MLKVLLALAGLVLCCQAKAEGPWVYEFELGWPVEYSTSRLLLEDCRKVVPVEYVQWYAVEPRRGWEISCGNDVPLYNHFLGRRCWKPLPNLVFECGWRHMSSPGDQQEIEYDAISVRGRFTWGRRW